MVGAWSTPRRKAPMPREITSMLDGSPYRAGRIPALNIAEIPRYQRRPLASEGFSVDASWAGGGAHPYSQLQVDRGCLKLRAAALYPSHAAWRSPARPSPAQCGAEAGAPVEGATRYSISSDPALPVAEPQTERSSHVAPRVGEDKGRGSGALTARAELGWQRVSTGGTFTRRSSEVSGMRLSLDSARTRRPQPPPPAPTPPGGGDAAPRIRGIGAVAAGARPPRQFLSTLLPNESSAAPALAAWTRPAEPPRFESAEAPHPPSHLLLRGARTRGSPTAVGAL